MNKLKNQESKKDYFKQENYSEYLYSGLTGYFSKKCHKILTPDNLKKEKKILEIGPCFEPHLKHQKLNFQEYHCIDLDTVENLDIFYKENYPDVKFSYYDGFKIKYEDEFFDRVIISQCLEHIKDPELFIYEMIRVLKKGKYLSIALPCDNGILWRLGRWVLKKTYLKKKNITEIEHDYQMANEHVNTIFQLQAILNKKFKITHTKFYPFNVNFPDINLYYICHILK